MNLTIQQLNDLYVRIEYIQQMSTTVGIYQSNPELLVIVDHLSRVAGALALTLSESLSNELVTSDPYEYLSGKLSIAESSMKRYYNKLDKVTP